MKNHFIRFIAILAIVAMTNACNTETKNETTDQASEIKFNLPEGFTLEEIYHPSNNGQGSWVALAQADNDQMYACDQYGNIYQFNAPKIGETLSSKKVIPLELEIGEAHGLLWAFNSLYVAVNKNWDDEIPDEEERGSGIYRITDADNDGALDSITMLLKLDGAGEHGPHSFVLSPDGTEIYFIAGNHTLIPETVKENSLLPTNWGEDNLFPPYLDARGHANDIKAPGGWIAKFNEDGTDWELISAGYRNPFDMAFNNDGELFAYDADMEWDIGMPWYRPTRINHVTSGSEYGWRTGSGKWPAYYPDNLPAVHNLEQGSPTAVLSASTLNFPSEYKNGLFIMDWSFGTVYFIDLKPNGSSYTAEREEFLSGTPLPLTDMIAGHDGNLYFATGGRRLDSHLYRLRYTGPESTAVLAQNEADKSKRNLRKQLEQFHKATGPEGVSLTWQHLNEPDRFLRYAARVVLEHQPLNSWLKNYTNETDAVKIIEASIALTHQGDKKLQPLILNKLQQIDINALPAEKQMDLLRAYSLNFIRMGPPSKKEGAAIIDKLNPLFPNSNNSISKELGQILLYLNADGIIEKLVQQLEYHTENKTVTEGVEMLSEEASLRSEQYGPLIRDVIEKMPPSEAIYYGMLLSNAKEGWTKDLRKRYFLWYYDVLAANGGMSFKAYMENVRQRAMNNVPDDQRPYFEEISGSYSPTSVMEDLPQPIGPGGNYTGGDMGDIVWGDDGLNNYKGTIEDGKRAFAAATCILCHRIRGEGGATGPDLTQAHTKFGTYDLLFAIYSPNDEISDQYANTLFHLENGNKIAGRIKSETDEEVVLMPNPFNETYTTTLNKKEITKRELSPISLMPSGLLNRLGKKEIVDLIAYINAGGDENHELYSESKEK